MYSLNNNFKAFYILISIFLLEYFTQHCHAVYSLPPWVGQGPLFEKFFEPSVQDSPFALPDSSAVKQITVRRGQNLFSILRSTGLSVREVRRITEKLRKVYDPRTLKVGQKISVHYKSIKNSDQNVESEGPFFPLKFNVLPSKDDTPYYIYIPLDKSNEIKIIRDLGQSYQFIVEKTKPIYHKSLVWKKGEISSSFFSSASELGIPRQSLYDIIDAYGYNVDFQRDLRSGDQLEVLIERFQDSRGVFSHYGRIVFSSLSVQGQPLDIYWYKSKRPAQNEENQKIYSGYFEKDGTGVQKSLMRTPVPGAHITSGFGRRKHPILNYTKKHQGIDFAARTGTIVKAAGDGVVTFASWNGGYGRYVMIRHTNGLHTAYAHLSQINVRVNHRVTQGQIIGRVGQTGLASGPHLHFEILKNGRRVNPLKVKIPSGTRIVGEELAEFSSYQSELIKLVQLARAENEDRPVGSKHMNVAWEEIRKSSANKGDGEV